jgi:hypothetical protein
MPTPNKNPIRIADRATPFTSTGGRVFATVPADNLGYRSLPFRSRALYDWFFTQFYSEFESIPSARAFVSVLHHLEAQAARNDNVTHIRVPMRIDFRSGQPR